jgi:hypothetical protein
MQDIRRSAWKQQRQYVDNQLIESGHYLIRLGRSLDAIKTYQVAAICL